MTELKPFTRLNADDFFRVDMEKIRMAFRLAKAIRSDVKDIRTAGDEVEIAVRNFFRRKLFPKYHVCGGHIIDRNMTVSQQIDLIIADKMKNPVFNIMANESELIYYEPVYAYGEVKRSFYVNTLLSDFSNNIERVKTQMERDKVEPNRLECSNDLLAVRDNITDFPQRNMLFTFMFFTSSEGLKANDIRAYLAERDNALLPNMLVFLDHGVYVNIDKKKYTEKRLTEINLYPELINKEQGTWAIIESDNISSILTYSYMLLLEHLKTTIVEAPDFRAYSRYLYAGHQLNTTIL